MLELVGIITLGNAISNIVKQKGLKPIRYLIIMVLLWVGFEIIGFFIGMILFGDVWPAYLMAFPGAALGGFISYRLAKGAPPKYTEASVGNNES